MIDWDKVPDYIPLVSLMTSRAPPETRPAITRLIEQAVVVFVGAVFGGWVSLKLLEHDVLAIKQQIQEVRSDIAQMRHDLYEPRGLMR